MAHTHILFRREARGGVTIARAVDFPDPEKKEPKVPVLPAE